jgi:hypothetical protein
VLLSRKGNYWPPTGKRWLCASPSERAAPLYLDNVAALRLQYLGVELDASLFQIENPFARELLAYVESERMRNTPRRAASG